MVSIYQVNHAAFMASGRPIGFLIKPKHVSIGIGEASGEFGCVHADGLDDAAAVDANGLDGGGQVIHHDVKQQARCGGGRPARDPGTTYFADAIVKRGRPVTPPPRLPSQHGLVEGDRPGNVCRRNLEVANLPLARVGGMAFPYVWRGGGCPLCYEGGRDARHADPGCFRHRPLGGRLPDSKRRSGATPSFAIRTRPSCRARRGKAIARKMRGSKYTKWSVIIRTCVIDELLHQAIAGGVNTVINLGAGLDARPYRLQLPASLRAGLRSITPR